MMKTKKFWTVLFLALIVTWFLASRKNTTPQNNSEEITYQEKSTEHKQQNELALVEPTTNELPNSRSQCKQFSKQFWKRTRDWQEDMQSMRTGAEK